MCNMIEFEVKNNIGILTYNRPPVNAFNVEAKTRIAEIFEDVNRRTDIYAVIFKAEGKGFSGGQELGEMSSPDADVRNSVVPSISRSTNAVYNCKVPVIAAVHGYVVGLGLAYASLCDVIIASDDSRFIMPEVKIGVVGGPFWLKRILPDKIARYYIYTGRAVPVSVMDKYGAILKVVPKAELEKAALEVAEEFAAMYPPSLWAYKAAIVDNEKDHEDIVELSDRIRAQGNKKLANDPNRIEMMAAQQEHRKPVYDFSKLV